MQLADAMAMVKRRRPRAEPIPAFLEMLKDYEKQCQSLGVLRASAPEKKKKEVGSLMPSLGPSVERASKKPVIGPELPNAKIENKHIKELASAPESLNKKKGSDENRKETVKRRIVGPSMPEASESPAKRQKPC